MYREGGRSAILEPVVPAHAMATSSANMGDIQRAVARGVLVRLLGPVGITLDGKELALGAPKVRMILATLALRASETVSTDTLIDMIWGARPPPTARKAVQVYLTGLRKLLASAGREYADMVQTRPGGYCLVERAGRVDLGSFETLWERGRELLAAARPLEAAANLRQALSLWRGDALSDLRYEAGFDADAARLDDMRLACEEDLMDAELACGHHAAVVPELERLVSRSPLRERLRSQLMLALYRSGRQADALAVYTDVRRALVEELGVEPAPSLTALERRILQQDPALEPDGASMGAPRTQRVILVVSQSGADVDGLLDVAIPLAGSEHEIVLARMLALSPGDDEGGRVRELTNRLAARRDALSRDGVAARVAAFASTDPARDLVRLARHESAALVLIDGSRELRQGQAALARQLSMAAPCDVGFHIARESLPSGSSILVPFGGSETDWAALELAGRLAASLRTPLVIAGPNDSPDVSRALATASLVLQRVSGATAEPLLIEPGARGVLAAADDACLIIAGLSLRYQTEGLGEARLAIVERATAPAIFVSHGRNPGVLAPPESLTRFRWSVSVGQARG